jgi:hypothetical protein
MGKPGAKRCNHSSEISRRGSSRAWYKPDFLCCLSWSLSPNGRFLLKSREDPWWQNVSHENTSDWRENVGLAGKGGLAGWNLFPLPPPHPMEKERDPPKKATDLFSSEHSLGRQMTERTNLSSVIKTVSLTLVTVRWVVRKENIQNTHGKTGQKESWRYNPFKKKN